MEEVANWQQKADERESDEDDLVDVIFAWRQIPYEMRCPEDGVVPEGEPGPPRRARNAVKVIIAPKRPIPIDATPIDR